MPNINNINNVQQIIANNQKKTAANVNKNNTSDNNSKMENIQSDKNVTIQDILDKKPDRLKGIKVVSTPNDVLDKNSFLKILLKQLEKQDPMKPQEDREFIAQMAQFSSLEQMKNVADEVKSMKNMSSNSFIGKMVAGKDFVSGKAVEGLVTNVILDASGQAFLRVAGKTVKIDDVTAVALAPESNPNQQFMKPENNVSRETMTNQGQAQTKTENPAEHENKSPAEIKNETMKSFMKMKLLQPSKALQQLIQ